MAIGATVILVVSGSTATSDGVDLSSLYAVDNNVAPVITYSYGSCEADNGTFNAYYLNLWQQAVSQGISVFVAAGDSRFRWTAMIPPPFRPPGTGTASADLASTPYNVAVGGTEFNEGGNASTYWSAVNSTGQVSSALSYIPEVAWNESAYISPNNANNGLWAGGGGVSTRLSDALLADWSGRPSLRSRLGWPASSLPAGCVPDRGEPRWLSRAGGGLYLHGQRNLGEHSVFCRNHGVDQSIHENE